MPLIAMPYPHLTVYLKPRLPPRQTKFLLLQCGRWQPAFPPEDL